MFCLNTQIDLMNIKVLSGIFLMLLLVGRAESKGGEGERSQQPIGNSNTSGIPFYEISTDDDNESCPSPNTSDTGESQNADRPAENIGDSGTYGTLSGLLPSNYFIPRNTPFGSGGLVRYSQSGLAQSVKDAELPISRVVPGQKRSAYVFEGRKEEAVDNRGKGKSQQGGEDAGALHLGHMPTATGGKSLQGGKPPMDPKHADKKRKRVRKSKQPPTTVIQTDLTDFRQLVQQYTGESASVRASGSGQVRIADYSNPPMHSAAGADNSRGKAPLLGTSHDDRGKGQLIPQGHSQHIKQHQQQAAGDDGAIAFYETIQGLLLQNRQMEENLRVQHFNKITALKRQHLALESSLRTKHIVSAKEKSDIECAMGICPSCEMYLCLAFDNKCTWNEITGCQNYA